ncbi:N-acetylmuramoyl-L-alanine amidase [Thermobifida halotolerans]|uniref:N-acetylmuramoyl-L-alanine amidase n=1 Tax=Thermobifida halotolerans TaxID=483545 RepID=A0AA97LVI7_9ACTN|nr:peptidoglycan recognition family protein [Thermobifida halotolerans]UOE18963.1 N-acetylmuramoyl-L-alanine amidase [Thermobifida halotolerans]
MLLGGVFGLATARDALAESQPPVYTRADWGARKPWRTGRILDRRPDHIVVHHTATPNVTDYSTERAFALSRSIQRYHMHHNGWNDAGQQFTISRGGVVMEGRDNTLPAILDGRHLLGAHVANHNSHTVGIENEGDYMTATPPDTLLEALVSVCAWLCLCYDLDPRRAIVGHRDFNATNCPGDRLYEALPRLREDTTALLAVLRRRLARISRHAPRVPDIPEENIPSFPDVPTGEVAMRHYHGPVQDGTDLMASARLRD